MKRLIRLWPDGTLVGGDVIALISCSREPTDGEWGNIIVRMYDALDDVRDGTDLAFIKVSETEWDTYVAFGLYPVYVWDLHVDPFDVNYTVTDARDAADNAA